VFQHAAKKQYVVEAGPLVPANIADLVSIMTLRMHVYALARNLTGFFPSAELLSEIHKSKVLPLLTDDIKAIEKIMNAAQKCLYDKVFHCEVQSEYNRLFIGPHALPAPLWESVYLDKKHILFGVDTLEVRKFYAACALQFSKRATSPDDHISIELEFMYKLSESVLKYLIEYFDGEKFSKFLSVCKLQLDFLNQHLLRWVPQSFALQLPHVVTPVYQGLAELLITFPPYDAELLTTIHGEASKW
jgi:TorA maturation chaperone TorD